MISGCAKWVEMNFPALADKTVATVSMEGYIPELTGDAREANTKGGLGVYFGDKLEGLAKIGIESAFGCMPMYHRRIVQRVYNGEQTVEYRDVSYDGQPMATVFDSYGKPIAFDVWSIDPHNCMEEKRYHVEVFCINRGGTLLYMFKCPEVFDVLYPDHVTHQGAGRQHRFLQETVFGQCVHTLLRLVDLKPDVILANEGHVAIAAAIMRGDEAFAKTAIVYTNHTVVPAGLELYDVEHLVGDDVARARYIMRFPDRSWQQLWNKFLVERDGRKIIDFSRGALAICNSANAVSNEHAEMTQGLFPDYKKDIIGVLNGSGDTWVLDDLLEMERKETTPTAEQLMELSAKGKKQAFDFINERLKEMTDEHGGCVYDADHLLDPGKPTVWLVRRLVQYKSQYPILKDIVHILCASRDVEVDTRWGRMNGLGMQVVVGGIAPLNSVEEEWIREFIRWTKSPELRGRFVFVTGCDTHMLKMQAIGADVCLNCPQPAKEACGTSDQRSARNGGINVAVKSGGPPEYIEDGLNGMLVGPYVDTEEFYDLGQRDILDKLAILSEMYYSRSEDDTRWSNMKLHSYISSSKVTAMAMEKRYAEVYLAAIESRQRQLELKKTVAQLVPSKVNSSCGTGVIYELVVRDYVTQNGRMGLSAATEDLEMIKRSGVDMIYLVGLMEHDGKPFEVIDPFAVDDKAGSFDELEIFIDKAHSFGIKVLLDWMANQHVSKLSPVCKAHPEWFLYTDGDDGNYYHDRGLRVVRGRDRDQEDESLQLVSATDLVSIKSFPRRWESLAQPDLSHPELRDYAVEIGKFWLEKGFDGFRVDAALATFTDKIKENWGLEVEGNLSEVFVNKMRQIKPDCFIMFEGFERHKELLAIADNVNCSVYNWKPRNFTTEMLKSPEKHGELISYLEEIESCGGGVCKSVNLGPEHDAFDFGDPWSKLVYSQRQIMYSLYQFLPGYSLVFNGQLDGQQHYFKADPELSEPVPYMQNADTVKSRAGRWMFNLRRNLPLITEGKFKVVRSNISSVFGVARYNENEMLLLVINPNGGAQEAFLDLNEIVNDHLSNGRVPSSIYLQEVVQPVNNGQGWISDVRDSLSAENILDDKFYVAINSCSCQLVRLCLSGAVESPEQDEVECVDQATSGSEDKSSASKVA